MFNFLKDIIKSISRGFGMLFFAVEYNDLRDKIRIRDSKIADLERELLDTRNKYHATMNKPIKGLL